jgi:hypothetical protein
MSNVGQIDRILRVLVGLVLIVLPFVSGWALWTNAVLMWGAVAIGVVLIATAAISFCPIYALLGLSSKRRQSR